jgi:hypothetical protein
MSLIWHQHACITHNHRPQLHAPNCLSPSCAISNMFPRLQTCVSMIRSRKIGHHKIKHICMKPDCCSPCPVSQRQPRKANSHLCREQGPTTHRWVTMSKASSTGAPSISCCDEVVSCLSSQTSNSGAQRITKHWLRPKVGENISKKVPNCKSKLAQVPGLAAQQVPSTFATPARLGAVLTPAIQTSGMHKPHLGVTKHA